MTLKLFKVGDGGVVDWVSAIDAEDALVVLCELHRDTAENIWPGERPVPVEVSEAEARDELITNDDGTPFGSLWDAFLEEDGRGLVASTEF